MHMADALVSPAVAGTMWAATGALTAYSANRVKAEMDERRVPLMGVVGAFIFSVQMINFAIPGTGSSGHLGGGMILASLLGPHAAFLTLASVLTVQALFFADGGLLALGCNVFNLAFFPCLVAYPWIFRKIVGGRPSPGRLLAGSTLSAVVGLQLGALAVAVETVTSGMSDMPFWAFVMVMQPIHLVIGVVEGLVTFAVVGLVWKARPEILDAVLAARPMRGLSIKTVLVGIAFATIGVAAVLSWFASSQPDGLEWSIAKTSGLQQPEVAGGTAFSAAERIQQNTAFLPEDGFRKSGVATAHRENGNRTSSVVNVGRSVSGLVGAALTLALIGIVGTVLRARRGAQRSARQ